MKVAQMTITLALLVSVVQGVWCYGEKSDCLYNEKSTSLQPCKPCEDLILTGQRYRIGYHRLRLAEAINNRRKRKLPLTKEKFKEVFSKMPADGAKSLELIWRVSCELYSEKKSSRRRLVNDTNWFYQAGSCGAEKQVGPVPLHTLRLLLRTKKIPLDTYVWHKSLGDWMTVTEAAGSCETLNQVCVMLNKKAYTPPTPPVEAHAVAGKYNFKVNQMVYFRSNNVVHHGIIMSDNGKFTYTVKVTKGSEIRRNTIITIHAILLAGTQIDAMKKRSYKLCLPKVATTTNNIIQVMD